MITNAQSVFSAYRMTVIRWIAFGLLLTYYGFANATTYSLPASLGASPFGNCSFSSGTTYNCTGDITIGSNDIITVTSSMTLKLTNGSFTMGNNSSIYNNGNSFTIWAPVGSIDLGNVATASVNLVAGGTINVGNNGTLVGDLTAPNINFGNGTVLSGACSNDPTPPAACGTPVSRSLSINNVSINEGNSGTTNFTFTVTSSATNSMGISVAYATGNGTATGGTSCTAGVDYIASSGTANLGTSLSTTITVSVCGDTIVESSETFTITLSNSTGATLGSPSVGTGTLMNDDGVTLHHVEIQHGSGTGLTCDSNILTIKACQDMACTAYTGGVSGSLTASDTSVVWDGSTGGATGAGFVIAAGSSTVTKKVQTPTAGTIIFGSSLTGTTCNFGSPACTFTASPAGFIFSDTTTGTTYPIPPQVSGITSNTLYLRAVKTSSANPAVCSPAIINQSIPVNINYNCNNPTTCQAGNLASINLTSISTTATAVSLAFDSNASAPIAVRYDDVGQITLNVSKTLTPFTGATAITLTGSSNAFVVVPHHFGFSGVTASPIKAGNNFNATVSAYNGLSTPTVTPNFGKETPNHESVTLSFSKYQPTGASASNGSFSGNVGAFTNGVATTSNLNWSEVGTIDLVATLTSGSYLGSGLTATGNTGITGALRFIPDHFNTTVTQGCNAGAFTYSAQPFTVTVTAKNGLATPTTTVNYDGSVNTSPNFSKLTTLSEANSVAGSLTPTTVAATAFAAGVANATPTFTFTTNPTAPATIKLRAVDTDAVSSAAGTEGTANIRSGRLQFSNAYGSELQNLALPLTAQYWNGTGWITNAADSCTTISAANFAFVFPVATSNNLTACETALAITGSAPTFTATLSKPGNNNNGWVDLTLNLAGASGNQCSSVGGIGATATSAAKFWLQYNWRGIGNTNPTARATFGVYKGNKKQIYFRELY